MSSELSAYEAAIRDLEAERQEIDALIDGLRRRLDKAAGARGETGSSANISDDAFFGMTVADASRKYLSIVKQTKTTAEIAAGLLQGGLKTSATDLPNTVRAIIGQRDEFMRVNGKWGLSVWYPGAKRSKQGREESESAKPKKPKDQKKRDREKKATKQETGQMQMVLKFLSENPGSHTPDAIADGIGAANVSSLRTQLSILVKRGEIAKGVPRGYQAK